jgi:hypothetical protein
MAWASLSALGRTHRCVPTPIYNLVVYFLAEQVILYKLPIVHCSSFIVHSSSLTQAAQPPGPALAMWSGGPQGQTEPPVETFRGTSPYKSAAKGRANSEPRNVAATRMRRNALKS